MRHACKKTFRSRGYNAAFQNQRLESGQRQAPPRVCVQGFRQRIRQHDARSARAEAMNHHPEWSNVWNKVVIDLNTHSVKGISDFDFVLADKINEIFEPFPPLR